jgi:hypothetical protein
MTGVVESATADNQSEHVEIGARPPAAGRVVEQPTVFAAIGGWRGVGWLACGVVAGLAIAWFILLAPGQAGPKSEWFFGAVVLGAVLALMWLTVTDRRHADRRAAETVDRLREEMAADRARAAADLAAVEDRLARELAHAAKLHEAELQNQRTIHRAEMDAARSQASIERTHLRNQLQKQAVIEVSRAVGVHTQMLATLWNRGAAILDGSAGRDEREQAMRPIFEQIGQVVKDFSVDLASAHEVVDDDRLSGALAGVNEAVLMGIEVAREVCDSVVEGVAPQPSSIASVQRVMQERAAQARRLAWDLVRTGLEDPRS